MSGVERTVDKLGRIVLPMKFRRRLGINSDDTVIITLEDGVITVSPAKNVCALCGSDIGLPSSIRICKNCKQLIKNEQ